MSQYSWLCSFTVSATAPPPSIAGLAPPPYEPMVIGADAVPEPFGHSCPFQAQPLWKRIRSPGSNVVADTLSSVFQGCLGDVPLWWSLPLQELT